MHGCLEEGEEEGGEGGRREGRGRGAHATTLEMMLCLELFFLVNVSDIVSIQFLCLVNYCTEVTITQDMPS